MNTKLTILEKVMSVNKSQGMFLLDKARDRLEKFHNKRVAILGLSFKPDTDDTREAPSLRIINSLLNEHAYVTVHDPVAKVALDPFPDRLIQCHSPEQAIQQADAVILCTDWPLYTTIDWSQMKDHMNKPNIFDGRNMLDAKLMTSIGFNYQGIGYR